MTWPTEIKLDAEKRTLTVGFDDGKSFAPEAAAAFGERINALVDQCFTYNRDLRISAYALDATARAYGFTDDEIAASFSPPR